MAIGIGKSGGSIIVDLVNIAKVSKGGVGKERWSMVNESSSSQ